MIDVQATLCKNHFFHKLSMSSLFNNYPLSKTIILSAFLIVDSLCAITNEVLVFINFSIACCTSFSDFVSKEEVASSKIRISGFFSIAGNTNCFSPPDNLFPLSPILV